MTVDDPMRDGAVFNQPLDDQSLTATDAPIMETTGSDSSTPAPAGLPVRNTSSTSLALSRTSSDSKTGSTPDHIPGHDLQKRQQRKLTKSRGNSDTNLDKQHRERDKPRGNSDSLLGKLSSVDKGDRPKGVLTKKDRQAKSPAVAVEDGEGARPENTPPTSKEEGATSAANGSASLQPSSLRDRLFPG